MTTASTFLARSLRWPAAWLVLAWAVAVLPNLTMRSFIWEEGNNAALARDILERGNLLEPSINGMHWA